MSRQFSIISSGPGQPGLLTGQAREAIVEADEAYACGRVAGALAALRADWRLCPAENLAEIAAESKKDNIAIAVGGDTGFFSGLPQMMDRLKPLGTVQVYPGMSSVQYLCAQAGESYDDGVWMEDGKCDLTAAVSYRRKIFLLMDGGRGPGALCTELCTAGLGELRVVVGTRLATGREHVVAGTAQSLRGKVFAAPALVMLINEKAGDPLRPVFDADLTAGAGVPMVRQEVRWNAANLLAVQPEEIVYDLGAGNGAMAMELARKANAGQVYAVDEHANAVDLILRNRDALGCRNVRIVRGETMKATRTLPAPDAAFIGSGAGSLREILGMLKEKNPKVRVVVAADSLERVSEAQMALSTLRYKHVEVSQLLLSRARQLGKYNLMMAGETMFLLSAGKA